MESILLVAVGLMLVIEGVLPFVAPRLWRDTFRRATELADGQLVDVFNDRGRYRCKVQVSERARPGVVVGLGVWWRKLGLEGTNVNELTHQRLTDMGQAAAFYDCLVEVRPVHHAS